MSGRIADHDVENLLYDIERRAALLAQFFDVLGEHEPTGYNPKRDTAAAQALEELANSIYNDVGTVLRWYNQKAGKALAESRT